ELERHRPTEPTTCSSERVGQRPPREPGDVAETIGGNEHHTERRGDVTGVNPGLGEPRDGERAGGQPAGYPPNPGAEIDRTERVDLGRGTIGPALPQRTRIDTALFRHDAVD